MQGFAITIGIDLEEKARIVLGFESPEIVLQQMRPTQELPEAGVAGAIARNAVFADVQPGIEVGFPLFVAEPQLADRMAERMRHIENGPRHHSASRKDHARLDRRLRGNEVVDVRPVIDGAHAMEISTLDRVVVAEEGAQPMRRQHLGAW
jgi:hypothetical protein